MTTITTQYMDEHPDEVLDTATHGPVYVTENGRKTYVLMSAEEYKKLAGDEAFAALLSKQAKHVGTS